MLLKLVLQNGRRHQGEDKEEGDDTITQATVQDRWRATTRGAQPRVDQLSERPSDGGQHCQPRMFELSLTHPLNTRQLLLWRHVGHDDFALGQAWEATGE